MKYKSTIVRRLDTITSDKLKTEIENTCNNWGSHFDGLYAATGALRHGSTCWLRRVDHDLKLDEDNIQNYPESKHLVGELAKNNDYGRAYWHKLLPGQSIDKHDDSNLGFSEKVLHRYQIYLDIPDNCEIILDEVRWLPSDLRYSVLDFNMYLPHSYNNKGDDALTFMVVDILIPGIFIKY